MCVKNGGAKQTGPKLDVHYLGLISGIFPALVIFLSDLLLSAASWGL